MIPAPPISLAVLAPTLIVMGAGCLVLLLDLLPPRASKVHLATVALLGVVAALLTSLAAWGGRGRGFRDMVILDNYALFFHVVICYGWSCSCRSTICVAAAWSRVSTTRWCSSRRRACCS